MPTIPTTTPDGCDLVSRARRPAAWFNPPPARGLGWILPIADIYDRPNIDAHRRIAITGFSLLTLIAIAHTVSRWGFA